MSDSTYMYVHGHMLFIALLQYLSDILSLLLSHCLYRTVTTCWAVYSMTIYQSVNYLLLVVVNQSLSAATTATGSSKPVTICWQHDYLPVAQ